jgi:ABC-type transporter Mla MlaB component
MTRCHGAYYDGVLRVICAGSPEVVRIAGELDASNYLGLVSALDDLVDREGDVHVNLAELTYCDVAGLRAILRLAGIGRNGEGHTGRCLFLDDVPQNLTRLLQILGWDSTPGLIMNEPASLIGRAAGATC